MFGSFATELSLPHSDIDLVIKIPNTCTFYHTDILRNLESKFQVFFYIQQVGIIICGGDEMFNKCHCAGIEG